MGHHCCSSSGSWLGKKPRPMPCSLLWFDLRMCSGILSIETDLSCPENRMRLWSPEIMGCMLLPVQMCSYVVKLCCCDHFSNDRRPVKLETVLFSSIQFIRFLAWQKIVELNSATLAAKVCQARSSTCKLSLTRTFRILGFADTSDDTIQQALNRDQRCIFYWKNTKRWLWCISSNVDISSVFRLWGKVHYLYKCYRKSVQCAHRSTAFIVAFISCQTTHG